MSLRGERILRAELEVDCEKNQILSDFNLKPGGSLTTELEERRLQGNFLPNTVRVSVDIKLSFIMYEEEHMKRKEEL